MGPSRLSSGHSDPVSFSCTCPASKHSDGGLVLLFYRYFSATPSLPTSHAHLQEDPTILSSLHTTLTTALNLGGKLRIGKEGFNITVGGTTLEINTYMQTLLSHWSLSNLDLSTPQKQHEFFKPTKGGCACVFGGTPASVQVKDEITPMGVTNYLPQHWEVVENLSPEAFHARCWDSSGGGKKVLIDVRNHYESRIGYFVDPVTGESAIRPAIRRFSQWPGFARQFLDGTLGEEGGRQILTYCTGGIRCEKGVRWMQENMEARDGDAVCTLRGGIAAYLMWMDGEIASGRKRPEESLFKGKNYVFDARGSMGLSEGSDDVVSNCHCCGKADNTLSKCRSDGCHLVLVVCAACEVEDPRCCSGCRDADMAGGDGVVKKKAICACEKEREAKLWGGGEQVKLSQGRKKQNKKRIVNSIEIDIKINMVD